MYNRMRFLISFILLLGLVQISAANNAGFIGWWKLDETSGITAADSSGNGNDGTLRGDPQWVSGWINGALNLDGDGDYVDCGYDPIFDVTGEITVAAWVTIRSVPTEWVTVVSKGEYAWRISNDSADPRFHFGVTIWSEVNPSVNGVTEVGYDEWHHVAGTYDGSDINLYLDGVIDATIGSTVDIGTNTSNVLIGENPEAAGRHWDGIIDDVRIYDRALSQAEIEALMPPQLKATVPNPADKAVLNTALVTLSWTAGETAVKHHLYIGESFEDVESGTGGTDQGLLDGTTYDGYTWELGKIYYWRVEEAEADGTAIHPGDVWSFNVLGNPASNPIPSNGAEYVALDVLLEWTGGANAIEHHVYFGDNLQNVQAGTGGTDKGTVEDPNFLPELDYDKTYYWKIDEYDGTDIHPGEVWSFTTVGPNNGAKGEYYNNTTLTGQPLLTRTDPTIDFDWGSGSPDPIINEASFSVRWIAELDVPYTETYTFYTVSDDNVRLWINGELIIDNWTADNAWAIEDKGTIDLVAGRALLKMEYFETGEAAFVHLNWESPSLPRQVISPGLLSPPMNASGERPANGAVGVRQTPTLRWNAGDKATYHNVYFGDDLTTVENADTTTTDIFRGQQVLDNTRYTPIEAPLEWNKTYYWRIEEVNEFTFETWKGNVWSFTTADYIILDDFEDYNDACDRVYYTWIDGAGHSGSTLCGVASSLGNGTGSIVGWGSSPYADLLTVHTGAQSMPMLYDNSDSPYYSEAIRTWDTPQDWTEYDLAALIVWFRGMREYVGGISYDSATQTYTMTGAGADIWDITDPHQTGYHDEFHFAYKQLSGTGMIMAKIESITDTHAWTKAGVMFRETLDADSPHVMALVTPGSGVSFQYRIEKAGACEYVQVEDIEAPHWVRLRRAQNTFTAEHSTDRVTWLNFGEPGESEVEIPMNPNTYIGLALTSHDAEATAEAVFSNVRATGTVSPAGPFTQSQDIGIVSNSPDRLYVIVEDDAGHSKLVEHSEPNGTQHNTWQEWPISLPDINDAGVDLKSIKKMYIGAGDRNNPASDGTGRLYIDDVRLYKRGCILSQRSADFAKADYAPAGDPAGDCVIDYREIEIMARDWLLQDSLYSPSTPSTPSIPGLIAYYPLDETAGTTAADASGLGNNGTLLGDPQWVTGRIGGALDFDGDGDYIDCGNDPKFDITDKLTVAAWLNIRSILQPWSAVIAKGDSAWRISNDDTTTGMHFGFEDGTRGWQAANSATQLNLNEWYHVCGVYDTSVGAKIYINGAEDGNNPDKEGITISTYNVWIGDNSQTSDRRYWDGLIDEVRVYDYALSEDEIEDLASGTVAGLVAHYEFNGDFSDSSSNGYDGDAYGASIVTDPTRGQVASFDGVDDYVDLPIDSLIGTLTNSTFATWVDFSYTGASWVRIFDFGSDTTVYMFLTPCVGTIEPMRFAISLTSYSDEDVVDAPDPLASGWHHVTVTIDADSDAISLYLDGELVGENTDADPLTPSDLGETANNWLGRSQWTADDYFNGSLDDFRIYDYVLSQAEIMYLAGATGEEVYVPLSSPAELYDAEPQGSRAVNFMDFAVLAKMWLEEQLYPEL